MKKNIETIEKIIREEKITYISNDGREFKTEEQCKKWEEDYKCTLAHGFNNLNKYLAEPYSLGLPCDNDDHFTYVVKLVCEEDVIIINGILNQFNEFGYGYGDTIDFNQIGEEFIIHFGYGATETNFWSADYMEITSFKHHKECMIKQWGKVAEYFKDEKSNGNFNEEI